MNDIETAKNALRSADVALCAGGRVVARSGRGVAPLLALSEEFNMRLNGCSAADKIVGKAAALLLVRLGAREVYGEVMSESAKRVFEKFGVLYSYGALVPNIINREGTGICPMEKATEDTDDPECAYARILMKFKELRGETNA